MAAKDLTPWKPGQSGNPSGKPPGTLGYKKRFELARRILEMPIKAFDPKEFKELKKKFPNLSDNVTIDEIIMAKIVEASLNKGNEEFALKASKHLRNEAYGTLPEGEEPEAVEEDEAKVVRINIVHKQLKSDKIE